MSPRTADQISAALREADALRRVGRTAAEVAAALHVSEATLRRWRAQYGGLKPDAAARIKELERENARLRRIVADSALQIEALRELSRGGW